MGIKEKLKEAETFVSDNSPAILTGLSIAGVLGTAAAFGFAGAKASRVIIQEEESVGRELEPMEKVKTCWSIFVLPSMMAMFSVACLMGAASKSFKINTALAGAYSLAQGTLSDYREQVEKIVGKNKAEKIEEEVVQERINKNKPEKVGVIDTGTGETLCFDWMSGRYFLCDIERVRKAMNEVNQEVLNNDFAPLNLFYYKIGLEATKLGDELGWYSDTGHLAELKLTSRLTEDDIPCLVIDFTESPSFRSGALY